MPHSFNARGYSMRGVFNQIIARFIERPTVEPHHSGFERASRLGILASGDHVAAADVDFVFERQRYGQRRVRDFKIAVERHDTADMRAPARWQREHFVSRSNNAGCDFTGIATEILIRPHHTLDGHAEWSFDGPV